MSFLELPEQWLDLPLLDPRLVADVLDLVVSDGDRLAGGLAVLTCDEQARLVQPMMISELDADPARGDRYGLLDRIVSIVGEFADSVIFALARSDGLSITADDEIWAQAARRACGGRVRLLGFHLVTRNGSRQVPGSTSEQPPRHRVPGLP